MRIAPLYLTLQSEVFKVLGTDLVSARVVSVGAGLVTLATLMSLARHAQGHWAAWLGGVCYATLFWAVAFERLATPDSLSVMFATLALAALSRSDGAGMYVLALLASVLATATKLGSIFVPGLVLVIGIVALATQGGVQGGGTDRRRSAAISRITATLLAVGVLSLLFFTAAPTLRTSGWWFPVSRPALSTYFARLLNAPLHAEFFLRMPVPLAGLCALSLVANRLEKRALRLSIICLVWIAVWWLVVPTANLKGARYYQLAVPITLLGTIGWTALAHSSTQRISRLSELPKSLFAIVVWTAALLGVWLSPRTGIRAARWFPLILIALFGGLILIVRLRALEGARRSLPRWFPALVALTACIQIAPLTRAATRRSTLVATAISEVTRLELPAGDVCGAEAPTLMLGRPGAGESLYIIDYPDCHRGNGAAKYVVVAEIPGCSPFEGEWITRERERLLAQEEVGLVRLPYDPVRGPRGVCRFRIVRAAP